jgi:1,4-dihydroxy-2-naphthoyl-CoA hydrolase
MGLGLGLGRRSRSRREPRQRDLGGSVNEDAGTGSAGAVNLPDTNQQSAFMRAAGLQFTSIAADRVEGYIDITSEHHQPWGIVHGGVYAAAIETSASMGAFTAAQKIGLTAVGVANNTNFLRSMSAGRVGVVALPLQQGRTAQLWEVRITDEAHRLVAIGHVRLQNVAPR